MNRKDAAPADLAAHRDIASHQANKLTADRQTKAGEIPRQRPKLQQGIALPRSAVVRSANGQDLIYEHVSAERFQPRPVRIEPLDGERVLVAAGIATGKRIVVQGAELLDQVR